MEKILSSSPTSTTCSPSLSLIYFIASFLHLLLAPSLSYSPLIPMSLASLCLLVPDPHHLQSLTTTFGYSNLFTSLLRHYFTHFDLNWSGIPVSCYYHYLFDNHVAFLIDYELFLLLHNHLSYTASLSEETNRVPKKLHFDHFPSYCPWICKTFGTRRALIWFQI